MNQNSKHQVDWLIIYGPTAVGKTELAIRLAQRMNGVMINADMGQAYAPLAIGTAKPMLAQLPVEHRLFDIIHEPRDMTVVEYRSLLVTALDELRSKKKLGVVTGGSGFYLSSVFFPPRADANVVDDQPPKDEALAITWHNLQQIDPVRAQQINPSDTYRIKRALALWRRTGHKPSQLEPSYNPPPGKAALVIVNRSREELYQRINERTILMLNDGWLDEVRNLPEGWQAYLLKKKLLGYDDIVRFVHQVDHGGTDYQLLIDTIAQKTRQYAKRQIAFGNFLARKLRAADQVIPIITIDLSSMAIDDAVTYLEGKLQCS